MKIKISLTAGMIVDQLPKSEQARVETSLRRLEHSTWNTLSTDPNLRKLKDESSAHKTFAYRVGNKLRIIFTVEDGVIHVLDVLRPDQLKRLVHRAGGGSIG